MKLAVPYIRQMNNEPHEPTASEHTVELLEQIDALLAEALARRPAAAGSQIAPPGQLSAVTRDRL